MSLKEWFGKGPKGDWVDIGAPKKKGKFQQCGRKSATGSKRKYPKCVPRSKAKSMTKSQIRSAVSRKKGKAARRRRQTYKRKNDSKEEILECQKQENEKSVKEQA